jgi:single-strand DNA-binding protein
MAGSMNKIFLIGNLGGDPELRRTDGGDAVTNFSVATTERYTDKQGQRQEQTEWHNIVVWRKQAEVAAQYLKKGSSVCIEGKITTRSWDNNGVKQYKTEIVASNFTMLDNKPAEQGGSFQQNNGGQQQQQQNYQQPQQQNFQNQGQQQQMGHNGLPVEDELPF